MKQLISSLALVLVFSSLGFAQESSSNWGVKFRMGGRYDNVRMCVASPAGATGGMAADVSLFKEFVINDKANGHLDIPIMRPVLFAAAFKMLQFEPTFNLRYTKALNNNLDLRYGPTIGVSLHYGPDYKADETLANGENSFFAMGPIVGAYIGMVNKTKHPRLEFGISPYVTPLFSINDAQNHNGIVVGGLVDLALRF